MKSNRVYCPLFLFVLVAMFFTLADIRASAQNVYETEDGRKFEVRLVPVEKEVFLNERPFLNVEIRNLSDTPLVFLGPGGNRLGATKSPDFKMTVIQPDGIVLPGASMIFFSGAFSTEGNPMAISPETIPPGGMFTNTVTLPSTGYFLVTGTHRFSIEYKLFIGTSDPKTKTPIPTRAETTIEAVAPDPAKVGQLVERLGKAMVKGDKSAAERLVNLNDPRRLPYFLRCVEDLAEQYAPQQRRDRGNSLFERALSALLQTPSRESDQMIERLLAHDLEPVRETTARLLADWRQPDKNPILFKLASDPSPVIRGIALGSLSRVFNPKTRAAIIELANDPDESVRDQARHILENSFSPPAEREYQLHNDKGIFTLTSEQPVSRIGQPTPLILEMKLAADNFPLFSSPSRGDLRVSIRLTDSAGQIVMEAADLPVFELPSAQSTGNEPRRARFFIPALAEPYRPGSYFVAIESGIDFKTPGTTEWAPAMVPVRLGVEIEFAAGNEEELRGLITDSGKKTTEDSSETDEALIFLTATNDRRVIPYLVKIAEQIAAEFRDRKWDGTPDCKQKWKRFFLATRALARFDEDATRSTFAALLKHPENWIRSSAANALRLSPHLKMRRMLLPLLSDPDGMIRRTALFILQDLDESEAEAILKVLVKQEDGFLKTEAFQFLEGLRRKKLGY